ncbi:MAG: MucBP domain-containing protein [Lachnospiraceae bacterium]|nr:MucBP domain-containing protein [Lachnospiraceae bacterium]
MKIAMRTVSLLTAVCLLLSASVTCLAAERKNYTYTVTISAGNQGVLSLEDGISITVDGGGDYRISMEDDGGLVRITGLTAANHIRFLNSAASVAQDSKYYVKGIRMGGRDESLELAYFRVERDQDYVVAYGIRGDMVQYTVNYQDAAGNQLYPSQTYYGNVGDRPVIAYLYVSNYQPQAYNLTRTLQSDASRNVFTFVYSRIATDGQMPGGDIAPGGGIQGDTPGGGAVSGGGTQGDAPSGDVAPDGGAAFGGDAAVPGGAGAEATPPGQEEILPEEAQDQDTPLGANGGEPEDIVDLDEGDTPLGDFAPDRDGTVAEANIRLRRNTWTAAGIGVIAVAALAAGALMYRKMRKAAGTGKDALG